MVADGKEKLTAMSFFDHLEDLRRVLVTALIILVVGICGAWFVSAPILNFLIRLLPENMPAHVFSPPEAFLIRLKVSAATALFLGAPIILWQIWSFLAPALYRNEKIKVRSLFLLSTMLFYLGTSFAYLVIIPTIMNYFFRLLTDQMRMTVGVTQLFAIVAKLSVAFGIVFQLPLVIFILTLMNLVSPRWLISQWRVAFIVMLVFSAILTPPDLVSQMLMTGPLFLLFIVSALISMLVERKRDEEAAAGSVDSPQDL